MIKFLISFLISFACFSQSNFQGEIIYNVSLNGLTNKGNEKTQTEVKVNDLYKKAHDVVFILKFNNLESIYSKDIKMSSDHNKGVNLSEIFGGGNDIFYYDKRQNKILQKKSIQTEHYLISRNTVNWLLTNERKKIGNYLCYKAIDKATINQAMPTVAWYAPEVTLGYGPLIYNGLPGLILVLTNNKVSIVAKKINYSNKIIDIEKPTADIKLTYQEFKERFKNVFNTDKK